MSVNTYNKTSPETGTCHGREFSTFINGYYTQFKDVYFFSYVIQFLLVTLMYFSVGSGLYWKILLYSSLTGLIGAVIENFTIAYICKEDQLNNFTKVYTFFISEFFWIITEYSIPYLNLIKMKALSKDGIARYIDYTIHILFIPFAVTRFGIGYNRMMNGYLNDSTIEIYHGIAFGIMAVADIFCSIFIIYFIKKYDKKVNSVNNPTNFMHYIRKSSFTILIIIDLVSIFLSLLYIYVNLIYTKGVIFTKISVFPLHSIKSVFQLILAVDACLFKYGANVSSINASSTNGTSKGQTLGSGNSLGSNELTIKTSNYKTTGSNCAIDVTSPNYHMSGIYNDTGSTDDMKYNNFSSDVKFTETRNSNSTLSKN